jgi:prepilin-type processing-associated H-X9-DG protein
VQLGVWRWHIFFEIFNYTVVAFFDGHVAIFL